MGRSFSWCKVIGDFIEAHVEGSSVVKKELGMSKAV